MSIEILLLILAFAKDENVDLTGLSMAIRDGDHNSFKQFYDAHYASLYRFLVSRGMSHDETEDLIQKAFITIWEKRDGIDETKSLRAYLFQIAYRQMINHIEYHSKFRDEDLHDLKITTGNPEQDIDYLQLLNIVRKTIATMPEKRKMVFELCFMKQFTYKETADALNVSVKTVENHMTLAFKDLRKAVNEYYGPEMKKYS